MSLLNNDSSKIPKLQGAKGFELWRLYVMDMMRKDGVLHLLNAEPPRAGMSSIESTSRFKRDDEKERRHIVLNIGEEPSNLVTSLLMNEATTKQVWDKLTASYQKENILSKLNLRSKLHTIKLKNNNELQPHLTQLEEIFVDLARLNDPVNDNDKNGILL